MRKLLTILLFGALAVASAQAASSWHVVGHQTIPLWPHGAPGNPLPPVAEAVHVGPRLVGGKPDPSLTNVSVPTITVYRPNKKNTGAAVLIFPGGGFTHLAINLEGTEVAQWFNSIGVTAFLVKYRVRSSGQYPKEPPAFEDAQRAMGIVRSRAREWNVDPDRIGVIGFSAGANLAVSLSNRFDQRVYAEIDAADRVSCRADFALIMYPAGLAERDHGVTLNPKVRINSHAPPTFLVQAEDDPVHVQNVIAYFLALQGVGIPAEMHIYAKGGHGYGLRPTKLPITHWPKLAEVWLHTIGILR